MADWKTTKIKYNGEYWNGLTYSPQDLCDETEGTLVLRSSNIKDGKITLDDNVYVKCPIESKALIKKNDILICSRNGSKELIGKNAIYTKNEKMAFGAFMMIYRCNNPRYMYYVLNSNIFKENIGLFSTSTVNQLTGSVFGNIKFPLPDNKIQNRIADFLDSKCSKIDSLKNDIEKQIETLEQYKKSVITEAVTKGINLDVNMKDSGIEWIGEIPEHWEVANPKWHFTQRKDRAKRGLQQLTASQKYGVITQDEYMDITGAKVVTVAKDFDILKLVRPGDFVIHMRSFQGGLEYSEKEGSISSAYVMLIPQKTITDHRFYKWFFKSPIYIDALSSTSNLVRDGQAMRYANFIQIPIVIPSPKEQKEIADYLDSKCATIDEIIKKKQQQLQTLEEYKKSLIFEYVTGKKEC